nr:WhiB family transcriptional regulator [Prauserella sediminis]
MYWRDRAACRNEDPDLFFPDGTKDAMSKWQLATAKSVCARCPVANECLADAITHPKHWGVFGGLDADERRAMVRAHERTLTNTDSDGGQPRMPAGPRLAGVSPST